MWCTVIFCRRCIMYNCCSQPSYSSYSVPKRYIVWAKFASFTTFRMRITTVSLYHYFRFGNDLKAQSLPDSMWKCQSFCGRGSFWERHRGEEHKPTLGEFEESNKITTYMWDLFLKTCGNMCENVKGTISVTSRLRAMVRILSAVFCRSWVGANARPGIFPLWKTSDSMII